VVRKENFLREHLSRLKRFKKMAIRGAFLSFFVETTEEVLDLPNIIPHPTPFPCDSTVKSAE